MSDEAWRMGMRMRISFQVAFESLNRIEKITSLKPNLQLEIN